ncbi:MULTISPECIES: J domain-containing protein [Pantoea]|nr:MULTISPECIES: J domain-containing protein [Pantoea]
MRTHYDNLKVSMDAPAEVIQAAYRSLAKKYHPDRNTDNPDSARIMQLVNTAYEVLSDPVKRAEHDTWIRQENWKRKQETLKAERAERESTTSQAEKTAAHFRSKTGSFNASRAGAGVIRVISRIISLARYAVIAGIIITFAYQFTHKNDQLSQAGTDEPDLTGLKIPDIKVPSQLTGCAGPLRTHPDGRPWGTLAKIMTVAENRSGLSSLTLDNSKNSQDLYVKLARSVDQNTRYFAREAFIPAHQQLTLQHLAVGNYVVKMMNIANGCAQVSPVLSIEETRTGRGIEYSNHSMTFYPVINGNTHLSTLSAADF